MQNSIAENSSILHLPNGIRIVHKLISGTQVAHCGFIIKAGSRDEQENTTGIAHFIEHMLFKGSKKYKASAILSRMDEVGAELNAYTTREHTSVYSSFPRQYLERAVDLLHDICFHSVFPAAEMEKEKKVIMEEYEMYLDSPEESIYDEFMELLFPGHPIGKNILGTPQSIPSFTRKQVQNYIAQNYQAGQVVFSYAGPHSLKDIEKLLRPLAADKKGSTAPQKRKKPTLNKLFRKELKKPYVQAHCILGRQAYHNKHKNRAALLLLNNYLGGPALNSRLNLSVREKYGYTYSIESAYTPYSDTGAFSIYLGTDPAYLEKCLQLINHELKKLCRQKLSGTALHAAKRQFMGQISLAEENRSSLMLALGKSVSDYNKADSLEEVFRKINEITAEQMWEVAREIMDPEGLSQLIYLPEK